MISATTDRRKSKRHVFAVATCAVLLLFVALPAAAQSPDSPSAIELFKESPESIARAASEALQKKDYDQAQELFLKAISLNKDDAGANYDPWKFPELDDKAKSHGESQLLKMLTDRQVMGKFIAESDDLYQWTKNKYATKILGREIDWDKRRPRNINYGGAEHSPPTATSNGRIRVRNAPLKATATEAFETLWNGAVFELHNMENAEGFNKLYEQAKQGAVNEDEFVKSMFKLEFQAIQRTRKWYVVVYLPHAKKYDLETDPEVWSCDSWQTADSAFNYYTDKDSYPWVPYLSYYSGLKAAAKE